MGVKLYLNTEDVDVLEVCAGVPAGTKLRYDQFLMDTAELDSYVAYCKCHEDRDLSVWHDFIMSGFGKFGAPVDDYSGNATGMDARKLFNSSFKGLHSTYVDLERIMPLINKYGVSWS